MGLAKEATILIVDGVSSARNSLKDHFLELGYKNLLLLPDGQSALQNMKSQSIDLIISEWDLPKMTGLELLDVVKQDEDLKEIPFLMVIAPSEDDYIIAAVQAGVNNYLIRPVTVQMLDKKIKKIFPDP